MQPTPQAEQALRKKLPIDDDEKILAVFSHHWMAYAINWAVTGFIAAIILVGGVVLGVAGPQSLTGPYGAAIIAGAVILAIIIFAFGSLPVYLRKQEKLVLTDEAILQILQPSLMASKVDQLGLDHMSDVSVRQDFMGTMFGYGHVTIETPGEQDDYEFQIVGHPQEVARQITSAHEEFDAALQGGRLPSSMGVQQPQAPTIDPQEFQQFLEFQQMQKMQQQQSGRQQSGGTPSEQQGANGQTPPANEENGQQYRQ